MKNVPTYREAHSPLLLELKVLLRTFGKFTLIIVLAIEELKLHYDIGSLINSFEDIRELACSY